MMRRREFLGVGAAGLSFVGLAGRRPGLFARAAEVSAKADANDHALVVIELAGGNDGLNTVVPFEDALYHRSRRTLRVPRADVLALDRRVGLHPRMGALAGLYREGKVAVVQGVGYPHPDRSHFRSMEIWQTASIERIPPTAGWLGRFLDRAPTPADAFPRGVSLTDPLPQALQAERAIVPVVPRLDAGAAPDESGERALLRKLSTAAAPPAGAGPVAFLRRQADVLYRTADRLARGVEAYRSTVEYPETELGTQLRRAAQVLSAGLGVRVLFASQDGYDTHANQAEAHAALLEVLSNALGAFQRDLAALGIADRVMVLVFSEFGRRVVENASGGTDHGAASCLFLVGDKVKGGLAGRYPSLETLDDGDLVHSTDFRSVYATVLERWMGCPAAETLGQAFPMLDLVAT